MPRNVPTIDTTPLYRDSIEQTLSSIESQGIYYRDLFRLYPAKSVSGYGVFCGPACIALSQILHLETGIPVGELHKSTEHLQIYIGIMRNLGLPEGYWMQTYMVHHHMEGADYIDPTILLERGKPNRIYRSKHKSQDAMLEYIAERFGIYPFTESNIRRFAKVKVGRALFDQELNNAKGQEAAMNHPVRRFTDRFAAKHYFSQSDWKKTIRVIQAVVPTWRPNYDAIEREERTFDIEKAKEAKKTK